MNHKKEETYEVHAKTVATRSHYRVRRKVDGVAIASVDQGQMASTYTIKDETQSTFATIKVLNSENIKLTLSSKEEYDGRSIVRGKQFEFVNKKDDLVLTIDKKLITLSDKYVVLFVEKFPAKVAALLPIIIDDYFHAGTTS